MRKYQWAACVVLILFLIAAGVLQQHMPSDSLKASCLAASELFLFLFFVILY